MLKILNKKINKKQKKTFLNILNIYNLICQKNEESRFLPQSLHKKTQPGQNFCFTLSKELSHTHAPGLLTCRTVS